MGIYLKALYHGYTLSYSFVCPAIPGTRGFLYNVRKHCIDFADNLKCTIYTDSVGSSCRTNLKTIFSIQIMKNNLSKLDKFRYIMQHFSFKTI